jgi:hypothetical protein
MDNLNTDDDQNDRLDSDFAIGDKVKINLSDMNTL